MSSFISLTNFFWSSWSFFRFSAASLFSKSFYLVGLLEKPVSSVLFLAWYGPVVFLSWLELDWFAGIGGAPSMRIQSFPWSALLAHFSASFIYSTLFLNFFKYSSSFSCWFPSFWRIKALIRFSCLFCPICSVFNRGWRSSKALASMSSFGLSVTSSIFFNYKTDFDLGFFSKRVVRLN